MKKPTPVLFVDLSAAFDHVEISWLFKTIKNRLIDGEMNEVILLLKALYTYRTAALSETPEDKFDI